MSVVFSVECAQTRPGDGVFLVGGADGLGNWSPALAPALTTTAETFPWWSSEPIVLPAGTAVSFKFVIQHEDRSGGLAWETLQETNRVVTPAAGLRTTAKTKWGTAATQCTTAPEPTLQLKRQTSADDDRVAQEKRLLKMAESSIEAAAAEAPQNSDLATELMTRESRRRNFSQSLMLAGAELEEEAKENHAAETSRPAQDGHQLTNGQAPGEVCGVPLKHIMSFSALSIMADPMEKDEARRAHKAQSAAQYEPKNLNVPVVVVTSEFAPFSKTGGLGLVAASYSYEFPRSGHRTMVVSPKYKHFDGINLVGEIGVTVNGKQERVKYWHKVRDGGTGPPCDCIFIDHPSIERGGGLYNDDQGREYPDNLFRFTLLCLAAVEAPLVLSIDGFKYGDNVVFLANDWQAGLVPLYMAYKFRANGTYCNARSIYVVHNLGYQGAYPNVNICHFFGVSGQAASDLTFDRKVNLSKGALICADRVLTVSPHYAQEIQTPSGGFGLQDFVRAKGAATRLCGILNGIDDCWNPEIDTHIEPNYTVDDFDVGKRANKAALQKRLDLNVDSSRCLIGFVGRLTWQKGVDVLGSIIPWLMEDTGNGVTGQCQLVMMGNGERHYADVLRGAEQRYPGRVCGFVGFDPILEHKIMAGCDLFLMPSRYEPCGLPQMICQQYGTLPIVTTTGGLVDSVKDIGVGPNSATGFLMGNLDPSKMKEIVYKAVELSLKHRTEFQNMQRTAMLTDFYWPRAMDEYERNIDFTLHDPPAVR